MAANMKIAVVGLGYVGLPLSLQFARSCVSVLGLDADPKKVELLNNGQSYIRHIQSAELAELVDAGKFYASTDFGQIKHVEAVIICLPHCIVDTRNAMASVPVAPGKVWKAYALMRQAKYNLGPLASDRGRAGNIAVLSGAPRFRVGLGVRRSQKQNLFLVAIAQSTNGFIKAGKKVFHSEHLGNSHLFTP